MKTCITNLSALAAASLLLAACGGGGSSGTSAAANTSTAADSTVVTTTLGDCFTLTPGVKFVRTNGSKKLVVQESFEGQTAIGDVELRADDTRFSAFYQTISGGYLHLLGINQYDISGVYKGKDVYSSEAQLPVNMAVGQTLQLTYTNTKTRLNPAPSVTTATESYAYTFVGLEDLTLGGRTFANTCKLSVPGTVAGQKNVSWNAKGFGTIRLETQDAQGNTVPGTRIELASIVSAP